MNKIFASLLVLYLVSLLSGCGSLMNLTYDQHEYFKELRNSETGRNIEDFVSKIPVPWQASILKVVKIDDQNIEYRFSYSKCSWASNVDLKTNFVTGWRFISAPDECKSLKYYQGPW